MKRTLSSTLTFLVPVVLLASVFLAVFGGRYGGDTVPLDHQVKITEAGFNRMIDQPDRMVLVKFGAPWCPPCVALDSELPKVAAELSGEVDVLILNKDTHPELADRFDVTTIPHMFLFKNGEAISSRIGMMPSERIVAWVQNLTDQ